MIICRASRGFIDEKSNAWGTIVGPADVQRATELQRVSLGGLMASQDHQCPSSPELALPLGLSLGYPFLVPNL